MSLLKKLSIYLTIYLSILNYIRTSVTTRPVQTPTALHLPHAVGLHGPSSVLNNSECPQ